MQVKPAIKIADAKRFIFEGDVAGDDGDLADILPSKLLVETDYMFSVYLKKQGRLLFVAIMRLTREGQVAVRMAFHQGQPEHLCDVKDIVGHLLTLSELYINRIDRD